MMEDRSNAGAGDSLQHLPDVAIDDTIHIDVSDEGVGFDPAESHQQVGLGLFSIKERLALFGGRLDIQSAKGKGARFSLTLPRSDLRPAFVGRSHNTGRQERMVYDSPTGTPKPRGFLSPMTTLLHALVCGNFSVNSPCFRLWARRQTASRQSPRLAPYNRTSLSWTSLCLR